MLMLCRSSLRPLEYIRLCCAQNALASVPAAYAARCASKGITVESLSDVFFPALFSHVYSWVPAPPSSSSGVPMKQHQVQVGRHFLAFGDSFLASSVYQFCFEMNLLWCRGRRYLGRSSWCTSMVESIHSLQPSRSDSVAPNMIFVVASTFCPTPLVSVTFVVESRLHKLFADSFCHGNCLPLSVVQSLDCPCLCFHRFVPRERAVSSHGPLLCCHRGCGLRT